MSKPTNPTPATPMTEARLKQLRQESKDDEGLFLPMSIRELLAEIDRLRTRVRELEAQGGEKGGST